MVTVVAAAPIAQPDAASDPRIKSEDDDSSVGLVDHHIEQAQDTSKASSSVRWRGLSLSSETMWRRVPPSGVETAAIPSELSVFDGRLSTTSSGPSRPVAS